jgi:hypothetical protein
MEGPFVSLLPRKATEGGPSDAIPPLGVNREDPAVSRVGVRFTP